MASAGPNVAGTGAVDTAVGTGALVQSGTGSSASANLVSAAGAIGGTYLTSPFTPIGNGTNYCKLTNFGFAIPTDATIDGIVLELYRRASSSSGVQDYSVRLYKAGTLTGDDKASASYWPTSYATATYGSSSDLWGTTWSYSDINNSGFGVAISLYRATAQGDIDRVQLTVHYTEGGGGGAASRLTKYAQNIPHMHGNNRFIRIGR
jgi:hypothetical protein